jgi:DNA-binding FadR family transcriptional regulator
MVMPTMENLMTVDAAEEPPAVDEAGERAAEFLTNHLAGMITSGELPTGSRLPTERELMRRFGVSRTVVREAIAGLATQRLISSRRGFRPVVQKPDYTTAIGALGDLVGHLLREPGGIRNLFESRIMVEGSLVRYAALHATRVDIEALRAALAANRTAIGEATAFYETDVALHAVLYRIPGNPIYPAVHRAYVEWLMSHWRQMLSSPEIDRVILAGHEAIVDAIIARDADGAEHALHRHLELAWDLVRVTFPAPGEPA